MIASYKFRMYPTLTQEKILNFNLETCRGLYNRILATISDERGNLISKVDTQNLIPQWKKNDPYLKKYIQKCFRWLIMNSGAISKDFQKPRRKVSRYVDYVLRGKVGTKP